MSLVPFVDVDQGFRTVQQLKSSTSPILDIIAEPKHALFPFAAPELAEGAASVSGSLVLGREPFFRVFWA